MLLGVLGQCGSSRTRLSSCSVQEVIHQVRVVTDSRVIEKRILRVNTNWRMVGGPWVICVWNGIASPHSTRYNFSLPYGRLIRPAFGWKVRKVCPCFSKFLLAGLPIEPVRIVALIYRSLTRSQFFFRNARFIDFWLTARSAGHLF